MPTLALKSPTAHILLHSGRFEVLLGPRGAGKRALLRTLAGLHEPGDARVYFGGVEITGADAGDRRLAFVPREGAAYPRLSARGNLALTLRCSPGDRRIDAVLGRLDLLACADVAVGELDPTDRQLVALAKAAVGPAPALLLDEPMTDLDSDGRQRVRSLLRDHVLAADRVLVLSSVDPTDAMLLGGGVHVVDAGAVLQRGTARGVTARPASLRVAELVGEPTFATWAFRLAIEPGSGPVAQFGAAAAVPVPPSFADLAPGEYRLGLPAHAVRVGRPGDDEVAVHGVVRAIACLGRDALLRAEHEGGELTALVEPDHGFVPGQAVELCFALADTFVFTPGGKTLLVPGPEDSGASPSTSEASSHATP